jgi:hypothetical protein
LKRKNWKNQLNTIAGNRQEAEGRRQEGTANKVGNRQKAIGNRNSQYNDSTT